MARISCILATKNRPAFLRQAIRCWKAQTINAESELVVVDDSAESCASLAPDSSNIKYVRLTEETFLGTKLNIGIEHASGEIIQKVDDDDYYHGTFLETLTHALTDSRRENVIAGCGTFLVLVPGSPQLRLAEGPWFAGGTLCFYRNAWQACPFRAVPSAVDTTFLKDHPDLSRIVLHNPELYILVRHRTNTWRRWRHLSEEHGSTVTDYFNTCPIYPKTLNQVVGLEDARFYQGVCDGLLDGVSAGS